MSSKQAAIAAFGAAQDAARAAGKIVEKSATQANVDLWHEACRTRDALGREARSLGATDEDLERERWSRWEARTGMKYGTGLNPAPKRDFRMGGR